jgi:hypothetical protein
MPWSRAKALGPPELGMALFNAQFRIQLEASAAAGRHIPMVVENVRGAQKWVGRSRWNFGSFHLWGDVPALMPMTIKLDVVKRPGHNWSRFQETGEVSPHWRMDGNDSVKVSGHLNKRNGHRSTSHLTNPAEHIKQGGDWFSAGSGGISRNTGSGSTKRKAASAMIAKIPLPLARHIAATYYPK